MQDIVFRVEEAESYNGEVAIEVLRLNVVQETDTTYTVRYNQKDRVCKKDKHFTSNSIIDALETFYSQLTRQWEALDDKLKHTEALLRVTKKILDDPNQIDSL